MKTQSRKIEERAAHLLSLHGKVAMVTGAASGIGRGISIRMAEMGAFVALIDIDDIKGRAVSAEIEAHGGAAVFLNCDVRNGAECRRAVDVIVKQSGKIDILCNCAGVAIRKDIVELTEDEWDLALDVTLKGIYLLSREVVPHMIRNGGGSIVNIGSGWSLKGGPRAASYCAAKGGAVNLTRAMAIDHGKDNIRVNCVCPGDVDTPMLRSECAQLGEDVQAFMREAANCVLFLVSPMAEWITGAALVVDGGGLA